MHAGNEPLLTASIRLNKKTAAAKLKDKLKQAETFLASIDPLALAEKLKSGPVEIVGVMLDGGDLPIEFRAAEGWAGVADRGTQVAVDARVTEELAKEGLARDIIRQVQEHRKNSGLEMQDRIALHLETESDEVTILDRRPPDHIAAETLRFRRAPSRSAMSWK